MYDNLKLEKGMYQTRKSFTEVLESLDPTAGYAGSPLEGLDAFQRQLKRYAIKASGGDSSTIEAFFQTSDSAVLFPEYVSRAVRAGVKANNRLSSLVAATTKISGLDYRTIYSDMGSDDLTMAAVAEGGEIPQVSVKLKDRLVSLEKRGKMLISSYEALRFQRLDVFSVTLRQIGAYLAQTQFDRAIQTLLQGDGNENPAGKVSLTAAGQLTYADYIALWNALEGYELTTLVTNSSGMAKTLEIQEFRDNANGFSFIKTGRMVTPLGAELIRSAAVPEGQVLGLDKNCALEMVTAGDVQVEYDKLIDRQLERAAITAIFGFSKIFDDAAKYLGNPA